MGNSMLGIKRMDRIRNTTLLRFKGLSCPCACVQMKQLTGVMKWVKVYDIHIAFWRQGRSARTRKGISVTKMVQRHIVCRESIRASRERALIIRSVSREGERTMVRWCVCPVVIWLQCLICIQISRKLNWNSLLLHSPLLFITYE